MTQANNAFYLSIPTFENFSDVTDPSIYTPLPEDWLIGMTDVVGSTKAIARGGYKSVNMAGAAGISAVINALGHQDFPFVFGGDGATFAVPASDRTAVEDALAKTSRWVSEEIDLKLRISIIPMKDVRAHGHDIRVARFATSPEMAYAMFAGRGIDWAETEMKSDNYAIPQAPPGAKPDLTGMSCRWSPIENQRGSIASVLVAPTDTAIETDYEQLIRETIKMLEGFDRGGHPTPEDGPTFNWPPKGLSFEARAARGVRPLLATKIKIALEGLVGWVLFKTGWHMGEFDPAHYRKQTSMNTDFRKFDGVLRMTVDCDSGTLLALRKKLDDAKAAGIAKYGIFEQSAAIMTCIVPSIMNDDHLHFLDGADGGYARAAEILKSS